MGDCMMRFWLSIFLFFSVVLLVGVMLLVAAKAHDAAHPERTEWFKSLKSHKGMCCDGFDALHLKDVDWETQNKDGSHYRVKVPKTKEDFERAALGEEVETEWEDVPDDAVVDEPNRDGSTLVWPLYGYMGVNIRCFMAGTMG